MSANLNENITLIANAANGAAALLSKAPFVDAAKQMVELTPVEINSRMYDLLFSCHTSTAWNAAKDGLTKALGRLPIPMVWESSGPRYDKRENRDNPFTLVLKTAAKAEKEAKETAKRDLAASLQQAAELDKERLELEKDRNTTEEMLVATLLEECKRLGLDPAKCLAILTDQVKPKATAKRAKRETATA